MPKDMIKLDYWQEQSARAARTIRDVFAKEQVREKIEQLTTETDPKLVMLGIIRLADSFSGKRFREELFDALIRELKVAALPPEDREKFMKQQEQWDAYLAPLVAISEANERREKRQEFIESLESWQLGEEQSKLSERARELRSEIASCNNDEEKERLEDELAEVEDEIKLCARQERRLRKRE